MSDTTTINEIHQRIAILEERQAEVEAMAEGPDREMYSRWVSNALTYWRMRLDAVDPFGAAA